MNRKQRNEAKKMVAQGKFNWYNLPSSNPNNAYVSLYNVHRKRRVNADNSRHQAKLRRLYHTHADWVCPKNAKVGYLACDRCHWLCKCKAMRTNSHPRAF